jgi:hypothetical protein
MFKTLPLSKNSPKARISPFNDGNNRSPKCKKSLPLVRRPRISKSLPLVDKWTHQAQIKVEIETPPGKMQKCKRRKSRSLEVYQLV